MYFLILGIILLLLKYLEIGPVTSWSWTLVLAPFGLAVLWWAWADRSGYTKRKVAAREDARKAGRIQRQRDRMGLGPKKPR